MAIIERTEEQREIERLEEIEASQFTAVMEKGRQAHELNIAKLKYAVQPRHKAVARVAVAFAKAPALFMLALTLPLLVLRGREIPKALSDFLSL
jgi:hypothetical protein